MAPSPTPLYPPAGTDKPLLRVGIMLDRWDPSSWIADVIASVLQTGVAEITTVILNASPPVRATVGTRLRRLLQHQTLLWSLYVRVDKITRRPFGAPFEPADVRQLLEGAKVMEVLPIHRSNGNYLSPEDVAAIREERLDVILRFGFNIVRGDILTVPRHGIWSYHHGDNHEYRGVPSGFWEMYERNPLTGTVVQVLSEQIDAGKIIYRSYGATRSFYSLLINRYWLYRKSIPFMARCLRRLYTLGPEGIAPEPPAPPYKKRLYRTPHNAEMVRFGWQTAKSMARRLTQGLLGIRAGHWFLAVARGADPQQSLAGKTVALYPPEGRFWADPMLAHRDGKDYIFFEDFAYRAGIGIISVLELDHGKPVGPSRVALETGYHLSYPFVFEWQGVHYMIPETASVRAVRLYRAVDFPTRWEHVHDLLTDVRAADATLCEHEGRWYLFASVSESGGSSWDEMFLFIAETPLGPWAPHPMNPIVSDVRRARPGGPLFRRNGALYRPAQNSERAYGHSLSIFEVTELTPERYAEHLAYRIDPDWMPGIQGCHTIAIEGDLVALDCKTTRWRP